MYEPLVQFRASCPPPDPPICFGGTHPIAGSTSSKYPLGGSAFIDCDCPIWAAGRTATGEIPRQSTGNRDLKTAEGILAALISSDKKKQADGPTLEDCIKKYLASHKHELGEKTYGQYKLHLGRLQEYCQRQGVHSMCELDVDLLETFKVDGLPDLADTSKSTVVAKLRCFLRDAFRRGWIAEPLVERVTAHRAVYDQKEPYSDDEVEKILNQALKLTSGTHGYARYPKTFRLLLELMIETGMRVGDAVRYNPALVVKGEHLWIYTYLPQKQRRTEKPKPLEAYLPYRLKQAIDACDWLSPKLPFFYGSSKNPAYLANEVYERMKTLESGNSANCGASLITPSFDCSPRNAA